MFTVRSDPSTSASCSAPTDAQILDFAERPIKILIESDDRTRVVRIAGVLDIARRATVTRLCIEGRAPAVIVDLSELTFLDCSGYGAFVAARRALELQYRTFELVGAVGEPRRLLDLIELINRTRPAS